MKNNFQWIIGCCLALAVHIYGQNVTEDLRPTFVIVAFRPGLQDPAKLRTNNSFFHGGDDFSVGETTTYGKKQAYGLGKFLRKRYIDLIPIQNSKDEGSVALLTVLLSKECLSGLLTFVREFFIILLIVLILIHEFTRLLNTAIKAISSSSENSQTTMQMVLSGMFGNDKSFEEFDRFSPSYSLDDELLKMGKSVCPEYDTVVGKFRDDSTKEVRDWLTKEKKTIDIVSQETGLNISLALLSNLGASVMHRRYLKQSESGQWTSTGTAITNLTKSVFEKLSHYADAPSSLCANDRSCRRLLAGFWVSFILETLRKKRRNESNVKLMLFSSSTDALMSAVKLLNFDNHSNTLPSGGFILEFKDKPEPAIRLITHDAEEENPDKRIVRAVDLTFCPSFDWCPLEAFLSNISPDTVGDWRDICKVRRCDAPLPTGKTVKSVDCPVEFDKSGKDSCLNWAKYNYCNEYDTVRWLYCRRTCLCDPEFV